MNNEILVILAVVLALGLVVVVAVDILEQQAQAARPIGAGCSGTSPAANASKTRCFNG
jgi:hypothetical protein